MADDNNDYARTALETSLVNPPVFNVTGELGRPNISVSAPTTNNNRILAYVAVAFLIWLLFIRKGR